MEMSEKKGNKKARSKDLTPKLSKDELLRRLKVSIAGARGISVKAT